MIIYRGIRHGTGSWSCEILFRENQVGSHWSSLPHVVLHSPDGFEWGYAGSGPADTALSILAHALGEHPKPHELRQGHFDIPDSAWEKADSHQKLSAIFDEYDIKSLKLHQAFKRHFVAASPKEGWEINSLTIDDWVQRELRHRKEVEDAANAIQKPKEQNQGDTP